MKDRISGADMTTTDLTEAKSPLSLFGRHAEAGESPFVLKHRRPAFVIAPLPAMAKARVKKPGLAKGRIQVAVDVDNAPEEVIKAFAVSGMRTVAGVMPGK